jgi:hypothetical protein
MIGLPDFNPAPVIVPTIIGVIIIAASIAASGRYYVFDCTKTIGTLNVWGPKWLAVWVAWVLTKGTGRFHDYDRVSDYEIEWNRRHSL